MTREDSFFYQTLGPFLSCREIVKELGTPVWDDASKVWIVYRLDGSVRGFCAFVKERSYTSLCSDWVDPDWRRRGIYRELFSTRLGLVTGKLRAMATASSLPVFLANGFTVSRCNGRYFEVRKDHESEQMELEGKDLFASNGECQSAEATS